MLLTGLPIVTVCINDNFRTAVHDERRREGMIETECFSLNICRLHLEA